MESFDLYDVNRNKSGRTLERGNKVPDGYYRLVVHVCIFGSDGRTWKKSHGHQYHRYDKRTGEQHPEYGEG